MEERPRVYRDIDSPSLSRLSCRTQLIQSREDSDWPLATPSNAGQRTHVMPALVVLVASGDLWIWSENTSEVQRIAVGTASKAEPSDDGAWIAFSRLDASESHPGWEQESLWVLDVKSGAMHEIASSADLESDLGATGQLARTFGLSWIPKSHRLTWRVSPNMVDGLGGPLPTLIRMVDLENGPEAATLDKLPFEASQGVLSWSPAGTSGALVHAGSVTFQEPNSDKPKSIALDMENIGLGHSKYLPPFRWAAADDTLALALPIEKPPSGQYKKRIPFDIVTLSAADSAPIYRGQIEAGIFDIGFTPFSPDFSLIAHKGPNKAFGHTRSSAAGSKKSPKPKSALWLSTLSGDAMTNFPGVSLVEWSFDGEFLLVETEDKHRLQLTRPCGRPVDIEGHAGHRLRKASGQSNPAARWINEDRFVFVDSKSSDDQAEYRLLLGDKAGRSRVLTTMSSKKAPWLSILPRRIRTISEEEFTAATGLLSSQVLPPEPVAQALDPEQLPRIPGRLTFANKAEKTVMRWRAEGGTLKTLWQAPDPSSTIIQDLALSRDGSVGLIGISDNHKDAYLSEALIFFDAEDRTWPIENFGPLVGYSISENGRHFVFTAQGVDETGNALEHEDPEWARAGGTVVGVDTDRPDHSFPITSCAVDRVSPWSVRGCMGHPEISADGKQVAYSDVIGLHIVDLESQRKRTIIEHYYTGTDLPGSRVYWPESFSPNQQHLLAFVGGYEGSSPVILDLETKGPSEARDIPEAWHYGRFSELSWLPDSSGLLVTRIGSDIDEHEPEVRIVDVRDPTQSRSLLSAFPAHIEDRYQAFAPAIASDGSFRFAIRNREEHFPFAWTNGVFQIDAAGRSPRRLLELPAHRERPSIDAYDELGNLIWSPGAEAFVYLRPSGSQSAGTALIQIGEDQRYEASEALRFAHHLRWTH